WRKFWCTIQFGHKRWSWLARKSGRGVGEPLSFHHAFRATRCMKRYVQPTSMKLNNKLWQHTIPIRNFQKKTTVFHTRVARTGGFEGAIVAWTGATSVKRIPPRAAGYPHAVWALSLVSR